MADRKFRHKLINKYLYQLLAKYFLFKLPPETAHRVSLNMLYFAEKCHFISGNKKTQQHNQSYLNNNHSLMGLNFPNKIGLAAGMDKNGDYIDALFALGFGFVEIGTVTPLPQAGNPKPRLFRLIEEEALINRLGFNNKGIEHVLTQLKKRSTKNNKNNNKNIIGVNIGKNYHTPLEKADEDYLTCFKKIAAFADYVTINISSPNTPGLRTLQENIPLNNLLEKLKTAQNNIYAEKINSKNNLTKKTEKKYVPITLKISPDLSPEQIQDIAKVCLKNNIDGIIATNTTLDRSNIQNTSTQNSAIIKETGGLSGKPLQKKSTNTISLLNQYLENKIPIIGCGGISSKEDIKEKMDAGAQLIQIYTGLIYQGPGLVKALLSN